jgi:AraC-like DNA-binding protein/ActR/RegA family two-component response regulator
MKPNIMVVEDDSIIALDVRGILEELGYTVVTNIASVDEAIRRIEVCKPDLVLIDINLKKVKDGVSLGHYLCKKGGIPYIYVSGITDKFTLERVKESRPHGFIVKPFKKKDISTTVALVLNNFEMAKKEADAISSPGESDVEIPYFLKDITDYIEYNIDKKITISELASRSRWKEQHFIRIFTNYIGETPYQYILRKKICKSKILISDTALTFSEISFELGFSSYGNFCNAFKKMTGEAPNLFRKRFSNKSV